MPAHHFAKPLRNSAKPNDREFDIRSISWTKVELFGFNFSQAYAGLRPLQLAIQTVGLSFWAGLNGIFVSLMAIWATGLLSSENISQHTILPGSVVISLVLMIFLATMQRGFAVATGLGMISLTIIGALAVLSRNSSINSLLLFASLAMIQALLVLWLISLTVAITRSHTISIFFLLLTTSLLGIGVTLTLASQPDTEVQVDWVDIMAIICVSTTGGIIGWNAFEANTKFPGIAQFAIHLAATGGTSFRQANLTEADFSGATLKHTDFRQANLTRTCWRDAKGLGFSRLGSTYLANPKIRQLVISCNGQGQNFDGLDLTGVNLQDANLQDASFVGASLNQSNLRSIDLSRAILKQTQLDGADLTGAILTGAYIEDWGITSTTNLENVQCEYIYMRVPTKENPNPSRKPDNLRQTFAKGEFADFIQPFFDTLDLYHSQDIDPRAISIALRNLAASHPDDDLQFVAIERRGNNGINLRFATAPRANKSELSHEYFTNYAQIKKELPVAVQIKLAEQDVEIRTLKGTIEQFIQTGTHQSTIQAETIQVIQGELVMTENRGIHINAGDNANIRGLSSGDGVVNLGTISGNVTNAINQLPEASESDQLNLKELLTQLQQAIQADVDLPDPDKSDLLEQVAVLAEAKQAEEPAKREGIARRAMKIFDVTLKSLPDTAKIVDACSKLLPLILRALGFPA